MKKSHLLLAGGACLALTLASCSSTDDNGLGYEEATPMNEYTVADGEIPIWLLDDGEQIAATESPRNNYPIPEATASTSSPSSSQNHPNLAEQDDTQVEISSTAAATTTTTAAAGTDPLLTQPRTSAGSSPKPATKPSASTSGPKKTASTKSSSTKKTGKRPTKKFNEPTLITYTVRPGDNLSTIAERSRTTVAQIRRDSGIKGDLIHPGQTIKVRYTPKNYKPGKKGSKSSTGRKSSKAKTYTVKSGDTVSAIAARHGVSTAQVMKANNLTNDKARRIVPGQKLTIPAK